LRPAALTVGLPASFIAPYATGLPGAGDLMNLVQWIWRSSLGRKYLMAGTGAALFFFLVGHLLGNLQIFGPPEMINNYAYFLQSKPELVWTARLGLLGILIIHIASAISLTAQNRAARPIAYASGKPPYGAPVASRTMLISGLIILAFVIYHLLHFTALLPGINGTGKDFSHLETTLPTGTRSHDVYAMMLLGFRVWWVSIFYLIAQALLFMHLSHGLTSMFQSLGWRSFAWWPRVTLGARIASVVLFLGYASIPIAAMTGLGGSYLDRVKATAAVDSIHGKEAAR
jgi:succinate dehydrogenase / fumarate reductase cytochrome b subunit